MSYFIISEQNKENNHLELLSFLPSIFCAFMLEYENMSYGIWENMVKKQRSTNFEYDKILNQIVLALSAMALGVCSKDSLWQILWRLWQIILPIRCIHSICQYVRGYWGEFLFTELGKLEEHLKHSPPLYFLWQRQPLPYI